MSLETPPPLPAPERWDVEVDVVVVGFGGAGASAALEAAEQGASVMLVERLHGGGTTSVSGGIVYLGGGTSIQKQAGFDDDPDQMFNYLRREVGDAVGSDTLRHFCDTSTDNHDWLAGHGVPFEASYCPFKTSYPTDDYYLYYSGNEGAAPYNSDARPAPRGHRARGPGLSGRPLFAALRAAVEGNVNIDIRCQSRVTGLVEEKGTVVGVEFRTFPAGSSAARRHRWASLLSAKLSNYNPRARRSSAAWIRGMEKKSATERVRVRARKGVVLASGGFIRNKEMVAHYAPDMPRLLALGSFGDDGSGIRLGQGAGGDVGRMDRISVWRFYNPPVALVKGILVDAQGERICNEELYGAAIGRRIVEHGNKAWLIIDSQTRQEVRRRLTAETIMFQRMTAMYLLMSAKKASSIPGLGETMGMPRLADAVQRYNAGAESGQDAFEKSAGMLRPILKPPFYALDVSVGRNPYYPTPSLTLGGLRVHEESGRVLDTTGTPIDGLYAAGRNAVGICSNGYVSGLAIADAVYSGRRAGRHAAVGSWR